MSAEVIVAETSDTVVDEDAKLEFRVVASGTARRGIRLERIFWQATKSIARNGQTTIANLIEQISDRPGGSNLASSIRVACLSWMMKRNQQLEALTSVAAVNAILTAVPSPAFALGANKKIVAFNSAFQTLVRRQFPSLSASDQRADLKLSLDVNVADLIARLEQNGNAAVPTGFVIGVDDRRFRGQLNAVKAPSDVEMILAFVIG